MAAKREAASAPGKPPIYDRAMLSLTAEQRAKAEANGKCLTGASACQKASRLAGSRHG